MDSRCFTPLSPLTLLLCGGYKKTEGGGAKHATVHLITINKIIGRRRSSFDNEKEGKDGWLLCIFTAMAVNEIMMPGNACKPLQVIASFPTKDLKLFKGLG